MDFPSFEQFWVESDGHFMVYYCSRTGCGYELVMYFWCDFSISRQADKLNLKINFREKGLMEKSI